MNDLNKFYFILNAYFSGYRLKLSSVTIATASVIYHKFFRENSLSDFDTYVSLIFLMNF